MIEGGPIIEVVVVIWRDDLRKPNQYRLHVKRALVVLLAGYSSLNLLNGIFLDEKYGEMGGWADRTNAISVVDANHQNANNPECTCTVPRRSHLRTAQEGNVHNRAGSWVFLFGIDEPDGSLRVASEQSDKALDLLLRIANETLTNLIVNCLRRI